MSLTLDLPPDLEIDLNEEAARAGLPLAEYAIRVLSGGFGPVPPPRNGAELVAYWRAEGLIGTRSDIADSAAHARQLRHEAERRTRP